DADLMIRTSDGVEFRVFKSLLGMASPVFRDMFLLSDNHPAPLTTSVNNQVEVAETGEVLGSLLTYVYPLPRALGLPLSKMLSILEAALKYEVESAIATLLSYLCSTKLIGEDPLGVFLFSVKFDVPNLRRNA
ncbi:hypothetical protein SISNIDRAFT_387282, partial [Sistotremastrum niveocremeum HHB9708]